MPLAGHTLELVNTALLELEPRPDHEVAQRAGHQHVVRTCQRAHPRTNVHGDPADVINAPPGWLTLLLHSGRADQRPAGF
jgi:hypothetical protein